MKNPAQFVKLQNALAADALNEYSHHTGSAVFACPPGLHPGQHWGDSIQLTGRLVAGRAATVLNGGEPRVR